MEFKAFDVKFDISFVIIKQNIKEIELIIVRCSLAAKAKGHF